VADSSSRVQYKVLVPEICRTIVTYNQCTKQNKRKNSSSWIRINSDWFKYFFGL